MKRYPKYKESDAEFIRAFPSHWQMKRLKHVTESIKNGTTSLQVQSGKTDYPVTRIETISTGEINFDKVGHVNYWDGIENYRLRLGDILLSHINSLAILGNCAMLENSACLYHGMNLLRIRPNSLIDDRFLLYWLKSYPTNQLIKSFAKFAIGQVSISITNLKEIPISYPPLIEQTQIANFLDRKTGRIDELIRIKERRIELLQEQRTALINQAVTKGLDPNVEMKPSGVEWIGEIPAHWEMINTKYLFRLVTEPAPQNNDYELLSIYTSIGVKPRKELEERGNRATTTDGYWLVKKGDFIVNKLLAWMGAIGLSDYEGVTSPAYDILRKTRPLNERLYEYLFRCGLYFTEFKKRSRGIMEVRLRLYFDQFGQIPLVFPPVDEQDKIVNFLDHKTKQIDELTATERRKIELLKEYRQSLISEAVTGKIDVRSEV